MIFAITVAICVIIINSTMYDHLPSIVSGLQFRHMTASLMINLNCHREMFIFSRLCHLSQIYFEIGMDSIAPGMLVIIIILCSFVFFLCALCFL